MGQMKKLFMQIHYPHGDLDLEREWLRDDSLKKDLEYEEYLKLVSEGVLNTEHTKIEVDDGRQTKIEVHSEEQVNNREVEIKGS